MYEKVVDVLDESEINALEVRVGQGSEIEVRQELEARGLEIESTVEHEHEVSILVQNTE